MRTTRVLAILLWCGAASLSADVPPAGPFQVLAKPLPSTQAGNVALDVAVKNISNQKQSLLTMSCSWWDDWTTDSEAVRIRRGECAQNSPLVVNLNPGQTYQRQLPLTVSGQKKNGTVNFKVAVRAKNAANLSVNDLVAMMTQPHRRIHAPSRAYWSDPISLSLRTPEK